MISRGNSVYIFFLRCWWTILLILFCYGFYLHGMHTKKHLYANLKDKAASLEKQLCLSIERREDLLLQIQSQADPAWTEMLLKKHLGMVPLGQTKVYFEEK